MSAVPCRVLVCDDQEEFREVITLMLGLEPGIEIVGQAADGRQAIDVATELRPDLVLLDVAMPVMDGIEALPEILASCPEARVLMLTGVVADSVRRRALEAGAAGFVEKGNDIEVLAERIREVCGSG